MHGFLTSKVLQYLSLSSDPKVYEDLTSVNVLAPKKHDDCGIMPQVHRETQ